MAAFNINACDYTAINKKYGYVSFNDINLFVSADLQWFCATRLYRSIKYDKVCNESAANNWWKSTMKPQMDENFPDMWKQVEGKGTQPYKGIYIHITLFQMIGHMIEPFRFQFWFLGEAWNETNKSGTLYLLQPPKYKGTNIIKIGTTKNFETRLDRNDYGKGTMILATVETNSRSIGEHHLKKLFNDSGAIKRKDIGYEYYEISSINYARKVFRKIKKHIPELLESDVETYKIGEWIHGEINDDDDE